MNQFHRIPNELKLLVQWVVWSYEDSGGDKPTKVPRDSRNGFHASVNDRKTWASFEQAVAACEAGRCDGIGFVFTDKDEYCGVDLDDVLGDVEAFARQQKIHAELNSYSELSPSGKGLHIIVKAKVAHGRKRSFVEIYSSGRFFTFTGNVFNDVGIQSRQETIDEIWTQMGGQATPVYFVGEAFQKVEDAEIFKLASEARNGDLFQRLWAGDWTGYPPNAAGDGSSEADFALVNILSFYSRYVPQIHRMFLASALGKRAKYVNASASRRETLVGYMVKKSFNNAFLPSAGTADKRVRRPAETLPQISPATTVARLHGLLRVVAAAAHGERSKCLYWAACRVGEMINEGQVSEAGATAMLVTAGENVGLSEQEATAIVGNGIRHG